MMSRPMDETREDRAELTKLALARALRARMAAKRLRQADVARWSGISRSYLVSLLRAEKEVSLFLCLELGHGLGFEDESELVRAVLQERDRLRQTKVKSQSGGAENQGPLKEAASSEGGGE